MGLQLERVSAPALEPVTLIEAKDHIKVELDVTADDALISELVAAARESMEEFLWRFLISQQWKLHLDDFPTDGERTIHIPRPPTITLDRIDYIDTDGNSQQLAATEYRVVGLKTEDGARVTEAYNKTWPSTRDVTAAVTVTFTGGYGANPSSVPATIRSAILETVAHWYEQRQPTVVGKAVNRMPLTALEKVELFRASGF